MYRAMALYFLQEGIGGEEKEKISASCKDVDITIRYVDGEQVVFLNGENVKRESYVRTPEYEAALEAWKETEQEWEVFLETLPVGEQEKAEEMKERLEDFASAQEKRAYIQGYVDCVQALYHMGLLKENEGLKWAEKMDVH